MRRLKLCVSLLLLAFVVCAAGHAPRLTAVAAQDVQFNRDIARAVRPLFLLSRADEKNRRRDAARHLEGATKYRGGYRAIAPGKPDESELLRRVTARMQRGDAAAEREETSRHGAGAELLRRWIAQGAKYEGPGPFNARAGRAPAVKNEQWVRNEVDRFILRGWKVKVCARAAGRSAHAHPAVVPRPDRPVAAAG